MKSFTLLFLLFLFIRIDCQFKNSEKFTDIIDESLDFAVKQHLLLANYLKDSITLLPKTANKDGKLITCNQYWWTSGFFPGSLWYLYEFTGDSSIKKIAELYSERIEKQKFTTDNHDVGFILYCSFGNGFRITGNLKFKEVLTTGAKSLSTRFRPGAGIIQSWDISPWNEKNGWKCPVIIDNMMNLELLCEASKLLGDSTFYKIAVSHADKTMKNHFRSNYSSYHVVDYNPLTGEVLKKQTHQGYSDSSSWARGQAWGLYGFTMMFRETHDSRYLELAKNIANYLINHPNLPEDKIPYWDYEDPEIPNTYRDVSAGAITCSALIELSGYVEDNLKSKYLRIAETQIISLSSPKYRAELGSNAYFILKHSVGSLPGKSEIDVPLIYADYYYIEALMRFRKMYKNSIR